MFMGPQPRHLCMESAGIQVWESETNPAGGAVSQRGCKHGARGGGSVTPGLDTLSHVARETNIKDMHKYCL